MMVPIYLVGPNNEPDPSDSSSDDDDNKDRGRPQGRDRKTGVRRLTPATVAQRVEALAHTALRISLNLKSLTEQLVSNRL